MVLKAAFHIVRPYKSLDYYIEYIKAWENINVHKIVKNQIEAYLSLSILIYYALFNFYCYFLPNLKTSPIRAIIFDSWYLLVPKPSVNLMAFFVCSQLVYFAHFLYFKSNKELCLDITQILINRQLNGHFANQLFRGKPIVQFMRNFYLVTVNAAQCFYALTCKFF